MSQPAKPTGRGGAPEEDDAQSVLATVRDLLTRSVMLPSDLLRETLDDAVRRGRMTRADAEDLVEKLVSLGRAQTEDALGKLDAFGGPGKPSSAGEAVRDRARSVVRRPPGTDRVLREVDRARRVAGLGSSFPVAAYDDLTAAQINERLDELSAGDLRKVLEYEKRNANRKSVLGAIEKRLR